LHGPAPRDHSGTPIHRQAIEVRGGSQEVRVEMPALHTLRIRGVARGQVHLGREGAPALFVRPDADGTAAIDGLPAGEYTVHANGATTPVSIPAQAEVTLPAPQEAGSGR
jgi:hypothetical protein